MISNQVPELDTGWLIFSEYGLTLIFSIKQSIRQVIRVLNGTYYEEFNHNPCSSYERLSGFANQNEMRSR